MGTRNLTIVTLKGQTKVAQYCQWDGYFTGQGYTIAEFLKKVDLTKFKKKVKGLQWATSQEIKDSWTSVGADPNSDSVSFEIADKHTVEYPEYSRDTGANILDLIYKGKVTKLDNQIDFLNDSLFCEFAYELDLDKKVVRIYVGFQKDAKGNYTKCKVFKTVKFKDFTKKLLKSLAKEEEEAA